VQPAAATALSPSPHYLQQRGLSRVAAAGPPTWHYEADGADLLKLDIDHVMVDGRVAARDGDAAPPGTRRRAP